MMGEISCLKLIGRSCCLLAVCLLVMTNAIAHSADTWYVLGNLGYNIPLSSNSDAKVFTGADVPNDIYHPNTTRSHSVIALEAGHIFHLQNRFIHSLSLGLSLQGGRLTEKGDITSLDLAKQYQYEGKARFIALLAMARFPIWQWSHEQFGVSGLIGMGLSDNRAYAYSETVGSDSLPRRVHIDNHSQRQFAYALGLFVHKALAKHLLVVGGYEYLNAGQARYGAVSTTGAQGPAIDVKMHVFSIGLQYQF